MGDRLKKLRLAAVQAAPVFLDREASVEKACRLIHQAGANRADVIGFPEAFIATHPGWYNMLSASGAKSMQLARELFKNSVEVPSPATEALSRACREANVLAVVGINEKMPRTTGTMYNTQLFIDRTGEILGKHQKLVPTNGERLVHTGGHGSTMRAFHAHFGAVSGLICGENSNPLAAFALATDYPAVHVAAWPAHFMAPYWMQNSILVATCGLAYQLKCFVINAAALVDDDLIRAYEPLAAEDRAYLEEAKGKGAASIIGPMGQVLAGPMGPGEGILYADVDLEDLIMPKLIHDFAGHYNRADIFAVAIERGERRLIREVEELGLEQIGGPASASRETRETRPALGEPARTLIDGRARDGGER
ncbi:MAG: carbon-nitrogen hydrolase family protein [Alphaproteobacteria bacterium]|nr:carbon-nitrogen hydrolase family protein [Alphaproteobacteria bacterium]